MNSRASLETARTVPQSLVIPADSSPADCFSLRIAFGVAIL